MPLNEHVATHDVSLRMNNSFGAKYGVEGAPLSLDGRTPRVRLVWILEGGSSAPRLVTAYPLEEERNDTGT